MNKIDLFKFLETGIVTKVCSDILQREISTYIGEINSQKGTSNIYSEDDIEEVFTLERLVLLLDSYLHEIILEWDLEYFLTYIELSFEIEDEKVEEVLFNFSDPYLGYPINSKNVKFSISYLQGEIEDLALPNNLDKELRKRYRSRFLFDYN